MFSHWRNPVPKPIQVEPGSPGFWEDSARFWEEMRVFHDKQARRFRDLMWMWGAVVVLLIIAAILAVVGG